MGGVISSADDWPPAIQQPGAQTVAEKIYGGGEEATNNGKNGAKEGNTVRGATPSPTNALKDAKTGPTRDMPRRNAPRKCVGNVSPLINSVGYNGSRNLPSQSSATASLQASSSPVSKCIPLAAAGTAAGAAGTDELLLPSKAAVVNQRRAVVAAPRQAATASTVQRGRRIKPALLTLGPKACKDPGSKSKSGRSGSKVKKNAGSSIADAGTNAVAIGSANMSPNQDQVINLFRLSQDLLCRIICIVMERPTDGRLVLLGRTPLQSGRTVSALGTLRLCSKIMSVAGDAVLDSIFSHFRDLTQAKAYMVKLPGLTCLSLKLPSSIRDNEVSTALHGIHILQPQLTSLILHYIATVQQQQLAAPTVAHELESWGGTMEFMGLHNLHLCSLSNLLHSCPLLKALDLRDTLPALTPQNLFSCPHLVEINLNGVDSCENKSLDLSGCPGLRYLTCSGCTLVNLNLSSLVKLLMLSCSENRLTNLNLSACTSLTQLKCAYNGLEKLDLTPNSALSMLDCSKNPLTTLKLLSCQHLHSFKCVDCPTINMLNLSRCTALQIIMVNHQNIPADALEACTGLTRVDMDMNQDYTLRFLNFINFNDLTIIRLSNCGMTKLNVTRCTALKKFELQSNKSLQCVRVSDCIALQELIISTCAVHSLTTTGCSALEILKCTDCPLEEFELLKADDCSNLEEVWFENTCLKVLDMSPAAATLKGITCRGSMQMVALCISGCSKLLQIDCKDCESLQELRCGGCCKLQFLQEHFHGAGSYHHITMGKLRDVGGMQQGKAVSAYMCGKVKMTADASMYWPKSTLEESDDTEEDEQPSYNPGEDDLE